MALPMQMNQMNSQQMNPQQFGGYSMGQFNTQSQPQQNLQNQSIQQLMQMLQGGQGGFEPIAQRARQGFGQHVSSLAERFSSLGSGGSQRSSAFQGALGSASSDLESQLAALGGQHQLGQQGLLSQLAMRPSFENMFAPPQQESQGLSGLLGGLGTGLGYAAPGLLGGAGSGIMALLNLLLGRGGQ